MESWPYMLPKQNKKTKITDWGYLLRDHHKFSCCWYSVHLNMFFLEQADLRGLLQAAVRKKWISSAYPQTQRRVFTWRTIFSHHQAIREVEQGEFIPSVYTWIYIKHFHLASLALSHATLLNQHGGLFRMWDHHRLVLTYLSLHQTASHCWEGKNEGNTGANTAMTFLDAKKDFVLWTCLLFTGCDITWWDLREF